MNKRMLSIVLFVVLLLCLLTGCGAQGTEPTTPPVTNEPTTSQEIVYDTPAQEAVVKTALSYLMRGKRQHYDDTRLINTSTAAYYRWQTGLYSPEDYTSQFFGYLNCTGFTYDLYRNALDYEILAHPTYLLDRTSGTEENPVRPYAYYPTGEETAEEQEAVKKEFCDNLQRGDIIILRYLNSGGHGMVYVGEDVLEGVEGYRGTAKENTDDNGVAVERSCDIIHCTGSSYKYDEYREQEEKYGTIQMMSTEDLFDETNHRYVFSKLRSIGIYRPLAVFEGEIPEQTKNRLQNLQGVMAEKLSSHTYAMTVNPGETMTFTFSIRNTNKKEVTVSVRDTVPTNTTYISGADTVTGSELAWEVTIPAGETKTVSYTVKVNEDAAYGDTVESNATVGGVATNCRPVYIERTLTAEEQKTLIETAGKASPEKGFARVNAIFAETLGVNQVLPNEFADVMADLYAEYGLAGFLLNDESNYLTMVPPGLFGGRMVYQRVDAADGYRLEDIRTRLPYSRDLMVGDIVMALDSSDVTNVSSRRLYLVLGDTMLDLLSDAENPTVSTEAVAHKLIAYQAFAVLRPSMAFTE